MNNDWSQTHFNIYQNILTSVIEIVSTHFEIKYLSFDANDEHFWTRKCSEQYYLEYYLFYLGFSSI